MATRQLTGTVQDVDERSLKLDGNWFKYTLPKYRAHACWHTGRMPQVGDHVTLDIASEKFISSFSITGYTPAPQTQPDPDDLPGMEVQAAPAPRPNTTRREFAVQVAAKCLSHIYQGEGDDGLEHLISNLPLLTNAILEVQEAES